MKKLTLPAILTIIIILILVARTLKSIDTSTKTQPGQETGSTTASVPPAFDIGITAQTILTDLENKKMENIIPFIGPDGVHFKLFYTPSDKSETTLQASDFQNFFDDEQIYTWGLPPSGMEMEATKAEIYDTIFDKTYSQAPFKSVDQPKLEPGNSPNIQQLVDELYKGRDIMYVEYYYPPTEEGGLDWSALSLVFEQKEGKVYLIGIFKDTWVP